VGHAHKGKSRPDLREAQKNDDLRSAAGLAERETEVDTITIMLVSALIAVAQAFRSRRWVVIRVSVEFDSRET
jgi:hypothetical protein